MVLKEWLEDVPLEEICFNSSTFTIQVHGLPLKPLNVNNARSIRSALRMLHHLSKGSIVVERFL